MMFVQVFASVLYSGSTILDHTDIKLAEEEKILITTKTKTAKGQKTKTL